MIENMSAVSQDYNSRFQALNISRLSQKVLMQFRHMTLVTPWHCVLISSPSVPGDVEGEGV